MDFIKIVLIKSKIEEKRKYNFYFMPIYFHRVICAAKTKEEEKMRKTFPFLP